MHRREPGPESTSQSKMGRSRSRSRSRSRGRYDDRRRSRSRSRGRGEGGGGYRGGPQRVSLLVRNLSYDTRVEDIKDLFGKYGEVRDVYCPLNYHTKEPQGFAFVEFYSADDAEYAKRKLDREFLNGREIAVIFAKQQRKRPEDMRRQEISRPSSSGGRGRSRSRSPPRRRRSPSRSRSRSRGGGGGGGRDASRSRSPPRRSRSRSQGSNGGGGGGGEKERASPSRSASAARGGKEEEAADTAMAEAGGNEE